MSLRVWLPFDGDLKNKGLSNISVTNNGATIDNNGKIGKCYNLDGASISFPSDLPGLCSSFSVCGWVKLNTGYATNYGFHILNFNQTYNRICISKDGYAVRVLFNKNGSNQLYNSMAIASSIVAEEWNHYAITLNSNKLRIYINGQLDSENTLTVDSISTKPMAYIGTYGTSELCKGAINDFRLYDHALSAEQVKKISQGLVLHYPLNNNGRGKPNLVPTDLTQWFKESDVTCTWESPVNMYRLNDSSHSSGRWGIYYNIILQANKTYTFSVTGLKINNTVGFGFEQTSSFPTPGPEFTTTKTRKSITITMGSSSAICKIYLYLYTSSDDSNLAYFVLPKLEEGAVETVYSFNVNDSQYTSFNLNDNIQADISGYGRNGTRIEDFTLDTDTSKYQITTNFNGTTNGILIQNLYLSNIINTEITYSFWIKPEGEQGGRSVYFSSYSGVSWSLEKAANNNLRSYWNGSPDKYATLVIADNVWQHIVITKKGNNEVKAYKNGQLAWTSTDTYNNLTFPTTYRIGRDTRQNDGTPYKGKMSDFRIYATALSAEDVKELYQYNNINI